MNNEEKILERLERLEQKISPLSNAAVSVNELKKDLTPRVNEAVQCLIQELADVEADFQIEDLMYLIKKAMRNVKTLNTSMELLRSLVDFLTMAEPLMKHTVPEIIFFFDALAQKGAFRLMAVANDTMLKICERYTPEEFEQMGEGLVRLTGVLTELANPKTTDLLEKAMAIPANLDIDSAVTAGPLPLIRAMGDKKVQDGLGVLLELTKGLSQLKGSPET